MIAPPGLASRWSRVFHGGGGGGGWGGVGGSFQPAPGCSSCLHLILVPDAALHPVVAAPLSQLRDRQAVCLRRFLRRLLRNLLRSRRRHEAWRHCWSDGVLNIMIIFGMNVT